MGVTERELIRGYSGKSKSDEELGPELTRLEHGVELLEELRALFAAMPDDAERDRAWGYLSSRFEEFKDAPAPDWEEVSRAG